MGCNIHYKGSLKLVQMFIEKELDNQKGQLLLKKNTWLLRAKDEKIAPELTAELNSSWQQLVSFSMVEKLTEAHSHQETC